MLTVNTGLIYESVQSKRQTLSVYGVDLVTGDNLPLGIFPVRVAIIAVRYIVTITLASAKAVVSLGTAGTSGTVQSLVANSDITHLAAITDVFNPSLASTLEDSDVDQALGLPIFEASTLLVLATDGGPTAGELMVDVDYFELYE